MDWWTQNKDAITAIGATITGLLAIGSIIWAVIKWGFLRGWQRKLRVDVSVFEVITDPAVLLPKLYATENDKSPLADHTIKYQSRDPKRDIQAELKAGFNRSRYLLITAPTGYGKTREAGVLAQTLMLEGCWVLRITKTGWLDVPKTFPKELNDNRSRILIFLDDLNGMFSTGTRTESPRAEKIPLLSEASYHDRLLQVLDFFEGACTGHEIRVIATARSEADQWKLLDFDEKDTLWRRFKRIELPEPADSAIINLLKDTIKQADLKGSSEEFESIARTNDGSYRNIMLNLRRWKAKNKPVSKDDFSETLHGSWRDIYESALAKHPAVRYIYDAIDVLRQVDVELFPFLVEPMAAIIWGGGWIQRFLRRQHILRAMQYLAKDTNILRSAKGKLTPSDGQIEARDRTIAWTEYDKPLIRLLLEQSSQATAISLSNLSVKFYFQKDFDRSLQLISRFNQIKPASPGGYNMMGVLFDELKRYGEAETAYRKAIELKPDDATAYSNLGLLLHENLKRYDEAETAYRKAIELNPDLAQAYYNLGNLLSDENLKRYDEAETAYRKAIELNPDDADVYYNLGILLKNLKRYDEAEIAYRKAIELNPDDANAYYNLASLKSLTGNFDDAFEYLKKAAKLDGLNPAWVWEDPDLQWIREDPRFVEIVGPKPE